MSDIDVVVLDSLVEEAVRLPNDPVCRERLRDRILTREVWEEWLWKCDPTEEVKPLAPLNRVHLIGLLIFRARSLTTDMPPVCAHDMLIDPRIMLCKVPICDMKLSQLCDNVKNLQLMWPDLIDSEDNEYMYRTVDAYAHRFGQLTCAPGDPHVLDDLDSIDVIHDVSNCTGNERRRPNISFVRRIVGFFFVVYRHLHLANVSIMLPPEEPRLQMFKHLISASLDTFFAMSMYYDTPVSSCMEYRHEFTGMFNSITQVMYYNNPSYQRRAQKSFEDIVPGNELIHILPLFLQLYPTTPLIHEDHKFPAHMSVPIHVEPEEPTQSTKDDNNQWMWVVLPGRIYLCHKSGAVYQCKNAYTLFHKIIDSVPEKGKKHQGTLVSDSVS
jgi:hypothetical protein